MESLVEFCQMTFVVLLGFSGCIGLLALVSPNALASVAAYGNQAVIRGVPTRFDVRRFDVDGFVLAHGRLFGIIVVSIVGYLWLISSYGPESYTKTSLLLVVAVAITMGVTSLCQLRRQSLKIEQCLAAAHTDSLTGLTNRRVFEQELSRRLAQRQRQGTPLSLLIIDIDRFKSFNDSAGHLLGDAILKEMAQLLSKTARQMDLVARLGGDEFVVLSPDCDLDGASRAAERLRAAVGDAPLRYEEHDYEITISIGLTEAAIDDDAVTLLKRADSALYAAKEAGRNRCFRHGVPEPAR